MRIELRQSIGIVALTVGIAGATPIWAAAHQAVGAQAQSATEATSAQVRREEGRAQRAEDAAQREANRAQRAELAAQREEERRQAAHARQVERHRQDVARAARAQQRFVDDSRCGPPPPQPDGVSRGSRIFLDGELYAGECARQWIQQAQNLPDLQAAVDALGYYYAARSRRQQTILDWAASGVVMTGVGYGMSGRIGVATQRAWAYSTLLLVVGAEWNALEPTRALFDAGYGALSLLEQRYQRIERLSNLLSHLGTDVDVVSCATTNWIPNTVGWTSASATADRDLLLSEYRRLEGICQTLAGVERDLDLYSELMLSDEEMLVAYRNDLAALDYALNVRDRELRHSPNEIFNGLTRAASRAIDTLLTSGESSQALTTVQIQDAVSGLSSPVQGLDAIPVRELSDTPIAVTPAVLTRASSSDTIGFRDPVVRASQLASSLEQWRTRLQRRRATVEEIRVAASPFRLGITWDVEARAPRVSLTPRSVAGSPSAVVTPTSP